MVRRKRIDYEKEGKDLIRNSKEFKELKQLIIDNGCKREDSFGYDYIYKIGNYTFMYEDYDEITVLYNHCEYNYPYRYYIDDSKAILKSIQYVYKEDIQDQIDDLRKYINKANNNHS